MSNHFKIIVPFYNVEEWIKLTIKSVMAQDHKNFQCILVDDISNDNSADVVNSLIKNDDRFVLVQNKEKAYALKNIYDAINISNPDPEDIIVTLDGDDWLAAADVLSHLSKFYNKEQCWLTYGSYIEYPSGTPGKFARQIPKSVIENASYRNVEWMTSHLRTFKSHLWQKIDVNDLKDSAGNFYQMTWDLSFMFPMLEMAMRRHRYIDKPMYVYNRTNPLNDDKVDHKMQLAFEREIRSKAPYKAVGSTTKPETAVKLLNSKRFDIAAKIIYAKGKLKNINSSFPTELYLEHLKVWNNFQEKTPKKTAPQDFIESFNRLLSNIKNEGFNSALGTIPTINDSAINGAHRIASCIVLDKDIKTHNGDISEGQYHCGFEYFKNKKDFNSHGLQEIYLDEMALEFCRNKKNLYTITLFPSHEYPLEKLLAHINDKNDIIYYKKIDFSSIGKRNYIHNLYYNEAWVGPKSSGYPGAIEKAKLCFTMGDSVIVLLIEEEDPANLMVLKEEIRKLCNVGKHSVHINDTQEETWRIASSVYNKNSVFLLNNKKTADTPKFDLYFKEYYDIIRDREDYEDFCIDSSAVISAYGLRDCRDLDFLHLKYIKPFSPNVDCHNDESKNYREKKDDIIYDPRLHFYAFGVKFASLKVVKDMKTYRNEEKDKVDVQLMETVL